MFEKENADMILEYKSYDSTIELQEGAQPSFGPIYNLLQTELVLAGFFIWKVLNNIWRRWKYFKEFL